MREALTRLLHLFYVGFTLARMHLTSYTASIASSVLWFTVIFVPVVVFTPEPTRAIHVFLPGVFGLSAASVGMWVATEFLRWYVYEGLTDMFRECGLNVFHYLLMGIHTDVPVHVVVSYFLASSIACIYVGLNLGVIVPENPAYLLLAYLTAIPVYLLCGALIAYLYTVTPIAGAWTNIIQMSVLVGTVIPPSVLPDPVYALVNPATIVAELARAAYEANFIPVSILLPLTPLVIVAYTITAYVISRACDRYIAKHGIRFRI